MMWRLWIAVLVLSCEVKIVNIMTWYDDLWPPLSGDSAWWGPRTTTSQSGLGEGAGRRRLRMWGEGRAPVTRTVTVLSVLPSAPPRASVRTINVLAGGFVLQPRSQLIQTQPRPVSLRTYIMSQSLERSCPQKIVMTFIAELKPVQHHARCCHTSFSPPF